MISALSGVTFSLLVADAATVDDDEIEMDFRRVLSDRFEVFPRRVTVRLAWLRHQVTHEDLCRRTLTDHACHLGYEQVRQNACVKRAGTDGDDVRCANRFKRLRQR